LRLIYTTRDFIEELKGRKNVTILLAYFIEFKKANEAKKLHNIHNNATVTSFTNKDIQLFAGAMPVPLQLSYGNLAEFTTDFQRKYMRPANQAQLMAPEVRKKWWRDASARPLGTTLPLSDQILSYSSDPSEAPNHRVSPIKDVHGQDIHYRLYVPKSFMYNPELLPPVVFYVYGGGTPIQFCDVTKLNMERILATYGCIVVVLQGEQFPIPNSEEIGGLKLRTNHTNFPESLFQEVQSVYFALSSKEKGAYIQPGKSKVFLYGASFGGYVTARMAVTSPYNQLFDGFIAFAGNYNYQLYAENEENKRIIIMNYIIMNYDFKHKKAQKASQHTSFFNENYLTNDIYNEEISPIFHLRQLVRPILLLAGIKDVIVNPRHQLEFLKAAKAVGKSQLVYSHFFKDQGHNRSQSHDEAVLYFIETIMDVDWKKEVAKKLTTTQVSSDDRSQHALRTFIQRFKQSSGEQKIQKKEKESKESLEVQEIDLSKNDPAAHWQMIRVTAVDAASFQKLHRVKAIRKLWIDGALVSSDGRPDPVKIGAFGAVLGNLPNLQELHLPNNKMGKTELEVLMPALLRLVHLREFDISGNSLGKDGLRALLSLLEKNRHLQRGIRFMDSDLTSEQKEEANQLFRWIIDSVDPHSIFLTVSDPKPHWKRIEIVDTDAVSLEKLSKATSVEILKISGVLKSETAMDLEKIKIFARILPALTNLRNLDLASNTIFKKI
jgi:acetyl esterase/lipase